ncbi:alpha/beta hydrolase domain-containing protein, partial [Gemmatimonadota bacterium]
ASRRRVSMFLLLGGILILAHDLRAEVVRVVVDRREVLLEGKEWGSAGAYEKLVGRILFAFDPESPFNAQVVDLEWAPRNGEGLVEAWADFMVLQPVDPSRRRGVAWLEVSNRGGKASLRYFNRASTGALDPTSEEDFGDGLLLNEGLTIIWVGWQWDIPDREGLLSLQLPTARLPGGPLQGLVRADWTVDEATDILSLGHRNHRAYPPASADHPDHILTVREGRLAPRDTVPREVWSFLPAQEGPQAGQLTGIVMEGGFQAGKIYELVYRSQDPRVVGLGLAAVRDVLSYARYELDSLFPVNTGVAFGVSQTGRFLRHFLYQGFNTDEGGRKVFDGMFIHTAGAGRGSFNHRFGQPSRDAHRYSAFFYPTDLFPFTSTTQRDPVSGREDGLYARQRADHLPVVFYTNTGYEYWGRAASLIHTSLDGTQDVEPRENERIYHLAGGQHFVGGFPPVDATRMGEDGVPAYRGNPLDFLLTLRALALQMVNWAEGSGEPPPSAFPRIGNGTLVPVSGMAFPAIPGVEVPFVIHEAYRVDYGLRWWTEGAVDRQPPVLGPAFPSLVSQVDGLGNELAGIRGVELRAPLATYAPWNLRWGFVGGSHELTDFVGTFVPLARNEAEREEWGDPRPSVEGLFGDKDAYMERVRSAARELVLQGFLLPEDAATATLAAEARWDWLMGGER